MASTRSTASPGSPSGPPAGGRGGGPAGAGSAPEPRRRRSPARRTGAGPLGLGRRQAAWPHDARSVTLAQEACIPFCGNRAVGSATALLLREAAVGGTLVQAKLRLLVLVALVAATVLTAVPGAKADTVTTLTGTLPDGATWKAEVPANWNGTLLLYSHGYVFPGRPNPERDVGDPLTGAFLLDHGFALAGSSYARTGWALQEGIGDQLGVLDEFDRQVGHPGTTIAWGHSLGGIMTAGLVQAAPERFDGALPMCGVLAGGV